MWKLVALSSGQNSEKVFRATKIVSQIKIEGVCGKLKKRSFFSENHSRNVLSKLQFPFEKLKTFGFQEVFTNTDKIFLSSGD